MSDPNSVYQAVNDSLKSVRSKRSLEALQQVCQEHFDSGAVDFRIATIAKLGANRGVPSAQTMRNKTGEHYRALLDAWQVLGESRKKTKTGRITPTGKYDWVERITDPSLKYLVLDTIKRNKHLTAENRHLLSIKKLEIDYRSGAKDAIEKKLPVFHDYEIDALKAAIDDKFLSKQGWVRGDRGCIKDANGKVVFKNGWIDVIEKIVSIKHG